MAILRGKHPVGNTVAQSALKQAEMVHCQPNPKLHKYRQVVIPATIPYPKRTTMTTLLILAGAARCRNSCRRTANDLRYMRFVLALLLHLL